MEPTSELHRVLKPALDARIDAMRAFTEELMRIPSENPPGVNYAECAAVIEARLRQMRLPVERIEAPEGRVIVRSSWGEGERTLRWWRRVIGAWYRDKAARDGQVFTEDDAILWEWIVVVRRLPPEHGAP